MGAIANVKQTLAAAVANAGTVVIAAYPAGTDKALLDGTAGGVVAVNSTTYKQGAGAGTVAIAYGASSITITNNTGETWPAGADFVASFGRTDKNGSYNLVIGTGRQDAAAGDGSNPNYPAS